MLLARANPKLSRYEAFLPQKRMGEFGEAAACFLLTIRFFFTLVRRHQDALLASRLN
jgi:hypothetical protein